MMTRALSLAVLVFASATLACAQEPASYVPPEFASSGSPEFDAWRKAFAFKAVQIEGKDRAIVEANLAGLAPDPSVARLNESQPEFVRPIWAYLASAVSQSRIDQGRAALATRREILQADAARIGVPAEIAVAIWGLESSYGAIKGNSDVVRSLASFAYAGRRQELGERELLAVFDILARGEAERATLVGSWAGAMGHTQFMPSSFLSRAVDGDGDGRRDIWNNPVDALASTMNYLAKAGWNKDEPWGTEISVPDGFDWSLADGSFKTVAQWRSLGLRRVGSSSLEALPQTMQARVLAPAGAGGAAFLLGRNFEAIKSYNNADAYALAVALLADQIAGRGQMPTRWPTANPPLARSAARELQGLLNGLGYEVGTPDGAVGPRTRAALQRFQKEAGFMADGYGSALALEQVRQVAQARGLALNAPPPTQGTQAPSTQVPSTVPSSSVPPATPIPSPPAAGVPASSSSVVRPAQSPVPPSRMDPNYKGPPPVRMTW
jgi:membrane-bound lytic murein transglycosylase B